jgi:hypothetical protein
MQYLRTGTIVFLLPYLILICLLQVFSVPLIPAIVIRVLAFFGCTVIAIVRSTDIGYYRTFDPGTLMFTGGYRTFDPVTFIFIAGLLGAPVFVHLAALGVAAVAISVLGVAVLSWVAVLTSVRLEEFTLFFLFIGTLPAQITFAAMIFSDQHPALAMLSAVVVGILTVGLLCWWVCGEEVWSSPDCRELAGHAAWRGAGAWAIFCAWTLAFTEIPPDGLHNAGLLALAVILSATTIKLMLSRVIGFPYGLLDLVRLALTSSLIDVGLGWLIHFYLR